MRRLRKNGEEFSVQKQIGSTLYLVTVHFSETSKETMDDKILRLIRNDIFSENIETRAAKQLRLWYNGHATDESAA